MASGKSPRKFGGVKKVASREEEPPASNPPAPKRRFAGVKASARGTSKSARGMQSCPENCPGEWVKGNWIHSRSCGWAAMLWRDYGFTQADWKCHYGCTPQELSSGWTHAQSCPYWTRYERQAIQSEGATEGVDSIPPNDPEEPLPF